MRLPEDQSAAESTACKWIERRAFVRVASDLTVDCRSVTGLRVMSWPGTVANISRGGLGLLLRHRFRPGSRLEVELRDRAGQLVRMVQVRVIHTTAIAEKGHQCWLIGCAFDQPLAEQEWQRLL